jgi:hypothetical protein
LIAGVPSVDLGRRGEDNNIEQVFVRLDSSSNSESSP